MEETPELHQALSGCYRRRVEEPLALAAAHNQRAEHYVATTRPENRRKSVHCEKLALLEEALAREYEALANLHEEEQQP